MDELQSDFRDMLINVGELVDENKTYLEAMKFRCKSIIKGKESEGITSALQLWTALEKRELIRPDDTSFLKELLKTCMKGIMPPLRVVENYENNRPEMSQVQNPIPQTNFRVPPQAQVVYHVQAEQPFHQYSGGPLPGKD